MSIHTRTSIPSTSGSPHGRLGRKLFVTAAGSLVLAAIVGGGLWARSGNHAPASPAAQAPAVVQAPATGALAVRASDGGYTPHTVYIVGSEEQAASVWADINDANVIRNDLMLPPMLDEVVVAATPESAAAVIAGFEDGNRILAALYQVENRIVDLRG